MAETIDSSTFSNIGITVPGMGNPFIASRRILRWNSLDLMVKLSELLTATAEAS
jgi:hypothetical protein